jgi:hypothetical protein
MSRKSIVLFLWLAIGAAAAGQRGYYDSATTTCSSGATIAATIATGPLNYLGVDPLISGTGGSRLLRLLRRAGRRIGGGNAAVGYDGA